MDVIFPEQPASEYCLVTMDVTNESVFDETHSVISDPPLFNDVQSLREMIVVIFLIDNSAKLHSSASSGSVNFDN